MVAIYAHRGASAELPENTLPAFARAVELGADGIELDVHLSADGVPVVIHDESVNRTTNGTGNVAELSLDQLKALDAGNGAPIPTLAEVLDLVGGRLHVDIEVKAAAAADAVLAETSARSNLRFAISSFNHDVLRHVRRAGGAIEVWPLVMGASDEALETAAELGSPNLAIYDGMVNQEVIEFVAGKGPGCWVWTVNDPVRAADLAEMGANGICTDDPARVIARLRP